MAGEITVSNLTGSAFTVDLPENGAITRIEGERKTVLGREQFLLKLYCDASRRPEMMKLLRDYSHLVGTVNSGDYKIAMEHPEQMYALLVQLQKVQPPFLKLRPSDEIELTALAKKTGRLQWMMGDLSIDEALPAVTGSILRLDQAIHRQQIYEQHRLPKDTVSAVEERAAAMVPTKSEPNPPVAGMKVSSPSQRTR